MKAQFSLTALIAAGLILQGCGGPKGPDSNNRGGTQISKGPGSSNSGGTQPATPASQGKASQASPSQQEAARVPGSLPAAAESISGSATSANSAPTSPIGSNPAQPTASAATSASAGSNPASNRQLDRDRGRLNKLDELTAKNAKMTADVDARATEGIRNAMSKANEADTHALDAGNRANQAQQTAQQAHTHIPTVEDTVSKIDQYQPITQAEIRFRPGQAALNKKVKETLDEMANTLKEQRGYIIEIQGFSAGGDAAAIQNSRQMAETVVRYLVLNHEIPAYRIYTVGMGNAPIEADDKKVRTNGGRVEITLLKNGLGDVGSSAAGNTSGSTGEVSGAVTATPASNQTEQPATPAANVAPASLPSNTGVTTKKPSSPSKPPQL
ncbi:MAG TPA: OmpA family protein [Candidatus Angelobacter sp.]|nr:OmpA family protein [Candidatus Angelobacter sp.]